MSFRLGLIINPLAGVGGSVALKGSDGADIVARALELGAIPKAMERTRIALEAVQGMDLEVLTWEGLMGENLAKEMGFSHRVLGRPQSNPSTADDTGAAAQALKRAGADLILFAGGDGTARNICEAVEDTVPVLGVPAGVKIHSGVYAITPVAAGELLAMLVRGELVSLAEQEVRDLDEEAFRQGRVQARFFGEMNVPTEHRYLQHVKNGGGQEDESMVLDDLAADFIERMQPGVLYVMGSGTTVAAIMKALGLENTLLGVDLMRDGELLASDCSAQTLEAMTSGQPLQIVITLIGGQGHIIGRGNQQLTPDLLRRAGKDNIHVVATKTKLNALAGRPLIVDSGDPALDAELAGLIPVCTGYRDVVLYPVAQPLRT